MTKSWREIQLCNMLYKKLSKSVLFDQDARNIFFDHKVKAFDSSQLYELDSTIQDMEAEWRLKDTTDLISWRIFGKQNWH